MQSGAGNSLRLQRVSVFFDLNKSYRCDGNLVILTSHSNSTVPMYNFLSLTTQVLNEQPNLPENVKHVVLWGSLTQTYTAT